jgi:hypothetical protein
MFDSRLRSTLAIARAERRDSHQELSHGARPNLRPSRIPCSGFRSHDEPPSFRALRASLIRDRDPDRIGARPPVGMSNPETACASSISKTPAW